MNISLKITLVLTIFIANFVICHPSGKGNGATYTISNIIENIKTDIESGVNEFAKYTAPDLWIRDKVISINVLEKLADLQHQIRTITGDDSYSLGVSRIDIEGKQIPPHLFTFMARLNMLREVNLKGCTNSVEDFLAFLQAFQGEDIREIIVTDTVLAEMGQALQLLPNGRYLKIENTGPPAYEEIIPQEEFPGAEHRDIGEVIHRLEEQLETDRVDFSEYASPGVWLGCRVENVEIFRQVANLLGRVHQRVGQAVPLGISYIDVSDSDITKDESGLFLYFPQLTYLDISSCFNLKEEDFLEIFVNLTESIQQLKLNNTPCINALVNVLNKFYCLNVLELERTNTADLTNWTKILKAISENIESLNIAGTNVTVDVIEKLKKCRGLKELNLSRCKNIQGAEWIRVTSILPKMISTLHFNDTSLDAVGAAAVGRLNSLRHISLSGCKGISAESWNNILVKLPPSLQILEMDGTSVNHLDNSALDRLRNLERCSMEECTNLTGESITRLLSLKPRDLKKLSLKSMNVDNSSLHQLASFEKLQELSLSACRHMGGAGITKALYVITPALTSLDISNTKAEDSCLQVLTKFNRLRFLNMEGCKNISGAYWAKVFPLLPASISELYLSDTNIDNETLVNLHRMSHLKRLDVSHLSLNTTIVRLLTTSEVFPELESLKSANVSSDILELCKRKDSSAPANPLSGLLDADKLISEMEKRILLLNENYEEFYAPEIWENAPITSSSQLDKIIELHSKIETLTGKCCTFGIQCINTESGLTPKQLQFVSSAVPHLPTLNLNNCKNVKDWCSLLLALPEGLQHLSLQGSNYKGEGIKHFTRFANLRTLNVSGLNLGWGFKELFSALPVTLEELGLGGGCYEGAGVDDLSRFRNLRKLNLSAMKPSDVYCKWPKLLSALPVALEELDLSDSTFKGKGAEHFSSFRNLRRLNLSNCFLRDHYQHILAYLPETLEDLDLTGTHHYYSMKSFSRFVNLRRLNLGVGRDHRGSFSMMDNVGIIDDLGLSGTNYRGQGVEGLSRFRNLRTLNLSKCRDVQNWSDLLSALPSTLEELDLRGSNYGGEGVEHLSRFRNLRIIN